MGSGTAPRARTICTETGVTEESVLKVSVNCVCSVTIFSLDVLVLYVVYYAVLHVAAFGVAQWFAIPQWRYSMLRRSLVLQSGLRHITGNVTCAKAIEVIGSICGVALLRGNEKLSPRHRSCGTDDATASFVLCLFALLKGVYWLASGEPTSETNNGAILRMAVGICVKVVAVHCVCVQQTYRSWLQWDFNGAIVALCALPWDVAPGVRVRCAWSPERSRWVVEHIG